MTAQFPEYLVYQGHTVAMFTNPLSDYLSQLEDRPEFLVDCSALWRGYQGTWELDDDRLYLIELKARLPDDTPASLQTVFPDTEGRVFAHWYCGTIRLPQGERLHYVHAAYESVYQRDLLLHFKDGELVETALRINDKSK